MLYVLIRFVIFIFCFIDMAVMTMLAFLCAFLPKAINKHIMPRLFRLVCWSFVRLVGRSPHIHEKFQPPLPQQYILISNHPSGYDIIIINALFRVSPLAKAGVRNWFLLGKIAETAGTIFVQRSNKESRNAAKEACAEAISQGKRILIYPEGGCFGKHLRDFKYGAFDISLATGVPILPIYLQYEAENAYEWGEYGLIKHLFNMAMAINKHIHCYIFDPIKPDGFTDAKSFAEHVHGMYQKWEEGYRLPYGKHSFLTNAQMSQNVPVYEEKQLIAE